MNNNLPDNAEKLVLYLDGSLEGAEKDQFLQQLQADQDLQAEFQRLKEAREAIRYYGLQQKVATIHTGMMAEMKTPVKPISSSRKIFRYTMAAAASLILMIGAWMLYSFFSLSADKVFASNYQSYELPANRGDQRSALTVSETLFTNHQYQELLSQFREKKLVTISDQFLCGMAAIELKDDKQAINIFRNLLEDNKRTGNTRYSDQAEYYLALTYIRNKDYDFALPILQKIKQDPAHTYQNKITGRMIRNVKLLKWR